MKWLHCEPRWRRRKYEHFINCRRRANFLASPESRQNRTGSVHTGGNRVRSAQTSTVFCILSFALSDSLSAVAEARDQTRSGGSAGRVSYRTLNASNAQWPRCGRSFCRATGMQTDRCAPPPYKRTKRAASRARAGHCGAVRSTRRADANQSTLTIFCRSLFAWEFELFDAPRLILVWFN